VIAFFDREDRPSLMQIIGELAREMATVGKSVMVHVEGTRSLTCRTPVEKMSSAFIDMALQVGAPIVPVRFVGALPVDPPENRLEYPVGYGKQDIWIGRPLLPEELQALPLRDRKAAVIDAINGIGPSHAEEHPAPADAEFGALVDAWQRRTGASAEHAALFCTLAARPEKHPDIARIVDAARTGSFDAGGDRWLAELAGRLYGERGPSIR
jgi:hypothetical protein